MLAESGIANRPAASRQPAPLGVVGPVNYSFEGERCFYHPVPPCVHLADELALSNTL